jgi:hypothetical protein
VRHGLVRELPHGNLLDRRRDDRRVPLEEGVRDVPADHDDDGTCQLVRPGRISAPAVFLRSLSSTVALAIMGWGAVVARPLSPWRPQRPSGAGVSAPPNGARFLLT